MRKIILIVHNLRSTHNVGSLLRTADGLGIDRVYLTGYTPYPQMKNDDRLPHLADKIHRQIKKTALGAEASVRWEHEDDVLALLKSLQVDGYQAAALEQAKNALPLPGFKPSQKIAVVVGREVEGIEPDVLMAVDVSIEIPMLGKKESFNVAQAAAMALYHCRFYES